MASRAQISLAQIIRRLEELRHAINIDLGSWDSLRASGESLVRRLMYAQQHIRAQFGVDAPILSLHDVSALPASLPQLLRGCGIRCVMIDLPAKTRTAELPRTYWWEGIDGSRVLIHRPCSPTIDPESNPIISARETPDAVVELLDLLEADVRELPVRVGELHLTRIAPTPSRNTLENRRCEQLLRDAEFLAVIHPGGIADYPSADLQDAWESLLRLQSPSQTESATEYSIIRDTADAGIRKALGGFAAGIDTADLSFPVAAWNTLSFSRSGLVTLPWDGEEEMLALSPRGQVTRTQLTDEGGERRRLVEVVDVPPMGYAVYDLVEAQATEDVTLAIEDTVLVTPTTLENGLVRVEFNLIGEVISYLDKQLGREIIAEGAVGNRFVLSPDETLNPLAEITVVESGPIRASLRMVRDLTPHARLVQYVRLEANSRRVDFETFLDWRDESHRLTVAFPVAVHSAVATHEIQFGHVERPTHGFSLTHETIGHKWADLSEGDYGVALLNDGRYEYDVRGNALRLTLLGAPGSSKMGQHHLTYSLLPHRGNVVNSGVPLAGYDLNVPLRAQVLPVREGSLAQTHSFFRVDKPNLVIESVKRAEDGDGIIVRLFEAFSRRGSARLAVNGLSASATRTDLLEHDRHRLNVHGGTVECHFRPFEVITVSLR